jgi:hypothetical protein
MAAAAKKRETRKSIRQPGWITLEGGFAARPCVVQDMSSTGAKITIDDPNMLPAKLRLAFSRDARTGRNCEVVWRRGKTAGIKFVR